MKPAVASDFGAHPSPTLIVGDMGAWVHQGRGIPRIEGYFFIDAGDLTADFLDELRPEVVLSPLVGTNFDALEVARKLGQMDFCGAYRVLTQNVPNIDLVLNEIRSVAPLLDVDVLDLADIFPDR